MTLGTYGPLRKTVTPQDPPPISLGTENHPFFPLDRPGEETQYTSIVPSFLCF